MRSVFCVLCVGFLVLVIWITWKKPWRREMARVTDDPRLTVATPFRNVRPEVKYVGDEACGQCHLRQAETYRQHPMGRSLSAVASVAAQERYDKAVHNPFESSGFQFLVERRGERIFHKEIRADSTGLANTEFEDEVQFAIGSGTRARSYLIERDGYLFQSAITWYAQKQAWDLSPGFAANPHSDRMITPACLFCHCNQVEPIENTVNRYRAPLFRGYAIGCERCHGPGELHVQLRREGKEVGDHDDSIVNPGRLEPDLREAVCQQCHLQGEKRVLRRGRQPFDYRPGLPLHLFWSVFVYPTNSSAKHRAVGQVEQMYASRCFRESAGELACISCHDAHALPPPAAKTAHYRGRCLKCHTEASCAMSLAERRRKNKDDDCCSCHMPRIPSSDVAHTAITDHRILRSYRDTNAPRAPDEALDRDDNLVPFYAHLIDPQDPEVARDLGVALTKQAELTVQDRAARSQLARAALPLLESAVQAVPQDLAACQARGYALWLLGRREEALSAFETTLAFAPQGEECLQYAAALAAQMGRRDVAVAYWRRALAVNPWSARAHYELAKLLVLRQDWPRAIKEGLEVVQLHPFHLEARQLLITCYLQTGDQQRAQAEFDKLLSLNPQNAEALRRLFPQQLR